MTAVEDSIVQTAACDHRHYRREGRISFKTLSGLAVALAFTAGQTALAAGDPANGAAQFSICTPCHTLEPERNTTGPSLAGIFGQKAAANASFLRYSDALKASGLTWDEGTLNAWLTGPRAVVPGNKMNFSVSDATIRADIIAYLAATQRADGANTVHDLPKPRAQSLDLKSVGPASLIDSMRLCHDTYLLKMKNGAVLKYWERDLRIKTDSSPDGPEVKTPALITGGMYGDRSYVVFAAPEEISQFIKTGCDG